MLDAATAAVEAAVASGRIGAREGGQRLRQFEVALRERSTWLVEAILDFRAKIVDGEPGIGGVPNDVTLSLAGMRREQRAYFDEMVPIWDTIDNAVEYQTEVARCIRDDDPLPNPADFGLPVESVASEFDDE